MVSDIPAGDGKIGIALFYSVLSSWIVFWLLCEPLGRKALVELVAGPAAAAAVELAVSVHSSPASSTSDIISPELILIITKNNLFLIFILEIPHGSLG